jgi:hypothetical protein
LAKKNIGNLREEFNMEAVINGKLRKLMLNFAIKAKMQGSEQQQWVKGTQTQEYLRLNRSVLPVAEEQMRKFWVNSFRIAYKEAEEEKKKKKGKEAVKSSKLEQTSLQFQIEEVGKDTKVSKKIDSPSTVPTSPQKSTDWDWTTDNRFCFTCNKYGHTDKFCYVLDFPTDHGHQATRGNQDIDSDDESVFVNMEETPKAKKVNFCNHCQKWGHAAEMCKEIFPEEEEPDFCRVCNRDGHIEENCWRLHPELKAEHDAKARELKKKQLCTGCGNMGHLRRWCYKLHPELQPGFYA